MNEKLEERLMSYLDSLAKQAETTGDFLGDQVPLVIQEYINFHFYDSLLGLMFFVLMLCLSTVTFLACCVKDKDDTYDPSFFLGKLCSIFIIVGSIAGTFTSISNVVKNVTAPRVVVLEKIGDLVKNNK